MYTVCVDLQSYCSVQGESAELLTINKMVKESVHLQLPQYEDRGGFPPCGTRYQTAAGQQSLPAVVKDHNYCYYYYYIITT